MSKFARLTKFAVALSLLSVSGAAAAQNRPERPTSQKPPAMPAARTLTTPPRMTSPSKQEVKTETGEQFFIVASIDRQNDQLLLKRPTEVTLLVKIGSNAKYFGSGGKPTTLASFRAGDTVWAKLSGNSTEPTLVQMREGEMTVADLHKYYLDYPIIK